MKKQYFIQSWGSYSNETFVCVGTTHDEIVKAMKKLKLSKDVIREFDKEKKEHDEKWLTDDNNGMMWFNDGRSVLWFKDWKHDWGHIDTLIHECYHAVHNILHKQKNMKDEEEACAYQLEYLVRSIRRKLKPYNNEHRFIGKS